MYTTAISLLILILKSPGNNLHKYNKTRTRTRTASPRANRVQPRQK